MNAETPDSPETWLDKHGDTLYRFAMKLTRDPDRAEDAVQETMVAALQAHDRYTGTSSVRTWLIGIMKHKIMDMFRHEAHYEPLEYWDGTESSHDIELIQDEMFDASGHWRDKPADWGDPESLLSRDQFMNILQNCMDRLPEKLARLFWLREILEEETESICNELAITSANLWTMLHRARLGLRKCIDLNWHGA